MVKYTLLLATAASVAAQGTNPSGMPNVIFPTSWDDWIWCCGDSGGLCPDACVRVNQGPGEYWYDTWGPGSDIYEQQESALGDAPVMNLPDGGFTDIDFVSTKCIMVHGFICSGITGVSGDPHFKTWSGEYYDYQGQCELKFLSAPDFAGVGLDIHIRTKIRSSYSFVESAAVKIGNDVLEVGSWGEYFVNGVEQAELPALIGGFPVGHYQRSEKEHLFDIFLGEDRRILIKNLKEWVSVHIEKPSDVDFVTSVGMMGDFMTGTKLARDGKTVIEDENQMGQEWQVQPDEPQLFVSKDWQPSLDSKCLLPEVQSEEAVAAQRRLLEERGVTQEKAEAACAHLRAHNEFCVKDVLASGDLDVATSF